MVTVPPHDVGSAPTLTSAGVAQGAEGTLRVTLACWEKKKKKSKFNKYATSCLVVKSKTLDKKTRTHKLIKTSYPWLLCAAERRR